VNSRRLAHINYKALPCICEVVTSLPKLKVDHEGICNGCVQGKNIKNPFPKGDSKTEGVPELIHSDVCGPMPSSSINGYVYYVSDPGGYGWPPTFSDWLKTVFWQFWQFTIFSRFNFRGHFEGLNEGFWRSRLSMIVEGMIEPPK
jgi:hypothetical protein